MCFVQQPFLFIYLLAVIYVSCGEGNNLDVNLGAPRTRHQSITDQKIVSLKKEMFQISIHKMYLLSHKEYHAMINAVQILFEVTYRIHKRWLWGIKIYVYNYICNFLLKVLYITLFGSTNQSEVLIRTLLTFPFWGNSQEFCNVCLCANKLEIWLIRCKMLFKRGSLYS